MKTMDKELKEETRAKHLTPFELKEFKQLKETEEKYVFGVGTWRDQPNPLGIGIAILNED